MSEETAAAKTPGQIACDAWFDTSAPQDVAWDNAAEAVAAPLRARIGELEAENENLRHRADAMTSRRAEARKLQTLVAELISVLREYGEDPAALARYRERAGLES